MKLLFTCINLVLIIYCLPLTAQDPVRDAYKKNEEKADRDLIDEEAAEFLVKAAEGRLMKINEGKLAVLKGTTSEVRNYGQLMVKDQATILDEIKKIAGERNITLPNGVSDKKREGQMDLSEEGGRDFDEKFIKMMESSIEQDLRLFEEAGDISDEDVASLVKEYLPLIQSHLSQLPSIKK